LQPYVDTRKNQLHQRTSWAYSFLELPKVASSVESLLNLLYSISTVFPSAAASFFCAQSASERLSNGVDVPEAQHGRMITDKTMVSRTACA
jgi:hypothetical protein